MTQHSLVGNALALPFPDGSMDVLATSPCYGNRMADSHNAQDPCRTCEGTGVGASTVATVRHPATFSDSILERMAALLLEEHARHTRHLRVLDPFGGVGKVHRLPGLAGVDATTVAVELEPEWAQVAGGPSPQVEGRCPACKGSGVTLRHTYRHALGRELHRQNAGALQWGHAYRQLHERAWAEALRVLVEGGLAIVNVSNHLRPPAGGGPAVEQHVVEWHLNTWLRLGCSLAGAWPVATSRLRHGANHSARVEQEFVLAFRTPSQRRLALL